MVKNVFVDRGAQARGWGDKVLGILFTVFIIAIVFGVILVAVTTSNSTLQTLQNQYNTFSTAATANSVNAVNANAFNSGNILLSWTGATQISAANPVTVKITGNTITNLAANTVGNTASSGASTTLTFTSTGTTANQIVTTTGNFYNISKIVITGLTVPDSGATASVSEYYWPWQPNNGYNGYPATNNQLVATAVGTTTQPTVGSSTQSPIGVFASLAGYFVTLANFTGIIILLAIIVVVIGILYYFFGNRSDIEFSGGGV